MKNPVENSQSSAEHMVRASTALTVTAVGALSWSSTPFSSAQSRAAVAHVFVGLFGYCPTLTSCKFQTPEGGVYLSLSPGQEPALGLGHVCVTR